MHAVTSPSELSNGVEALGRVGLRAARADRRRSGREHEVVERPAVTLSEAVPVLPPLVPVTVWAPAAEAVHVAPVHDPFGAIEKVVIDGDVAERVVVLVAALGRVGLRAARADRRRGGREHEVVERRRQSRSAWRCWSCRRRCPVTVCGAGRWSRCRSRRCRTPFGAIEKVVLGGHVAERVPDASKPSAV